MTAASEPLTGAARLASRDDRKSAHLAAERVKAPADSRIVRDFAVAREVLRNINAKQAGAGDLKMSPPDDPEHVPVFYLDGEPHRKKRAAIARFFAPKAITTRYHSVIVKLTEALLDELRADGQARLDLLSLRLAVSVAADVIGLTNSDQKAMATRIGATFTGAPKYRWAWVAQAIGLVRTARLYFFDVRPAIKARRMKRQEDMISHLLDEGYSDRKILIECMTYAAAGMVTTREFIVMVAWHLFERDDLRARFLDGDDDVQFAILEEILRLEPVASMIQRRALTDIATAQGIIPAGTLVSLDIRGANCDEAAAGACPHALDPDRAKIAKGASGMMSFGDGPHRCPGSQLALHETRIFLDRLLRVPGISLARAPNLGWCDFLTSYELRNAVVTCDRAA
jgi:cytochrome P450